MWFKTIKFNTALFILSLPMSAMFVASPSLAAPEQSQLQKQIKQQEQKIAEQKRQQTQLQSSLKSQENQMNGIIGELRQTEADLKETRKLIAETDKQIKGLERQEKQQKAKLAKQLDKIYRSGNPSSVIEHLLANNAQQADRMKVYSEHLNKARMAAIEEIRHTRSQLAEQKTFMATQLQQQQTQLSDQKKQQQSLQKVKNERQQTLNQLNKSLARDQNRLDTLRENEAALKREIQRAAEQANIQAQKEKEAEKQTQQAKTDSASTKKENLPSQPKATSANMRGLSGRYNKPVVGNIIQRYGSQQMGELTSKGIVISAKVGTSVRAIASGRVILASWLQGYGMVVVIDHGKNDMSLYGYNQALSVKTGTIVQAGQKIAEVGNSGGQSRTGLYFEIRRQGNTVNPMNWLK